MFSCQLGSIRDVQLPSVLRGTDPVGGLIGCIVHFALRRIVRFLKFGDVVRHLVGDHQEGVCPLLRYLSHPVQVFHHHIVVQEVRGYAGQSFFIPVLCRFQVPPSVIDCWLQDQRSAAEQTVHKHVAPADMVQFLQQLHLVFIKHPDGVPGADLRVFVIDAHVRNPLVVGVRRVAHGHLVSGVQEIQRHDFQRFVVLFLQCQPCPLFKAVRRILVSPEQRRRGNVGMISVGERVGIVCEAVELFPQFRLLVHDIGDKGADRPVQHDHHDVLSRPVKPEGRILRFDPAGNPPDFVRLLFNVVDIDPAHHGQCRAPVQAGDTQDQGMLFPQQHNRRRGGQYTADVQDHCSRRIGDRCLILQGGREESVMLPEEHIIDRGSRRHGRQHRGITFPAPGRQQQSDAQSQDQKHPRACQRRTDQIPYRVLIIMGIDKLCGRGADHRGRNQYAGQ